VADRHGIGTGVIYTWRKQMLRVSMTGFASVKIKSDAPAAQASPAADAAALPPPSSAPTAGSTNTVPGGIEVELPSGVRLRFGSDVDGAALRRILAALAAP
jgi:transposase